MCDEEPVTGMEEVEVREMGLQEMKVIQIAGESKTMTENGIKT